VLVLLPVLTLLFFTAAAYNPPAETPLEPVITPEPQAESGAPGDLRIVTWNLGYGGLDDKTDFVMEGGTMALPRSRQAVEDSLTAMGDFLAAREADVYFLQEVDRASSRSYKINQIEYLSPLFTDYFGWYARNYKALFVPYPLSSPLGKVDSGLLTLSRFSSPQTVRYQLPGSYSWPVRIFHLKRCAVFLRFPSPVEGKDWCLFNIHLSAYDSGTMRKEQLAFLKDRIQELYAQGHYVVVGGDWNSLFPGIGMDHFGPHTTPQESLFWVQEIPAGWSLPGWNWSFDPRVPTSRALNQPYRDGENFVTVIDGFYVSPNVEIREIQGFDLRFEWTDHNPAAVTLRARP
jgi:endonuclease/exonuclease/phosphatase family metal-dependent hydrolase